MSAFAFTLLCVQACLINDVFSQYCRGPIGVVAGGPAPVPVAPVGVAGPVQGPCCKSPYGGIGSGDVGVTGELPVSGITVISGHVPVLGEVSFSGEVPAGGKVSINGACGCPCGGSYLH